MAAASAAERRVIARIAANTRWSDPVDRTAATAPARAKGPASLDYWIRQVDPDGTLAKADADAVKAAAESRQKNYYERLALLGRRARAAKAAAARRR